ncbi:MAG: 50S ribosomal protein L20 [Flavobacteriales bacterium]
MPRAKNPTVRKQGRKKIFKLTKGYFGRKKNVYRLARNAHERALQYAYRDRRQKKREMRKLWVQRINAGARQNGLSYSQFIGKLKKSEVQLNRKVLADLAMNHPEAFQAVVEKVK